MARKPKFSIITTSLNKGKFIEQAILSVLKQDYPNFEHIIIDGGSTDQTLNILKKYPHLKWISEADGPEGYVPAMNKGIKMASGEIIGMLNADDYYESNIFSLIAKSLNRAKKRMVVIGNCEIIDEKGKLISINKPKVGFEQMLQSWRYQFPYNPSAYFYFKDIHKEVCLYNIKYKVATDYEFLLRAAKKFKFYYINKKFGNFRFYKGTLTYNNWNNNLDDQIKISKEHWLHFPSLLFFQIAPFYLTYYLTHRLLLLANRTINYLRSKVAFRTRTRRFIKRLRDFT